MSRTDGDGSKGDASPSKGDNISVPRIKQIIQGFLSKGSTPEKSKDNDHKSPGGVRLVDHQDDQKELSAKDEAPESDTDSMQRKLQEKFAAQRHKEILLARKGETLKVTEVEANKSPKSAKKAATKSDSRESQSRRKKNTINEKGKAKVHDILRHLRRKGELSQALSITKSVTPKGKVEEIVEAILDELKISDDAGTAAKVVDLSKSIQGPENKQATELNRKNDIPTDSPKSESEMLETRKSEGEGERKARLVRKIKSVLDEAGLKKTKAPSSKQKTRKKSPATRRAAVRRVLARAEVRKILAKPAAFRKTSSDPKKPPTALSDVEGFQSLPATISLKRGKSKSSVEDVEEADATVLHILPIDTERPPVPSLAYGLERVLFNPGVYQLQDPRSRVYNFDPYLQKIMPVADFDFNALTEYVTSSKDTALKNIAEKHGKRYVGSTSSMTGILAHFHFLLSQWRPINTSMLSKSFPAHLTKFTEITRAPSAIFLRWKDGSYAIDADKQFATANVLSMLGKSMEKLLTLRTEDYERYRKSDVSQESQDGHSGPESYHYSTMGDFLMRSQLDAHDPRLPGTGMFDLKTRAVVSIRMDVSHYEQGMGYQIKGQLGEWESYEREYYDMIRAAFLKYSMQVRMGRMDGIFVAFHNIERIFGFQYVSLPEMDSTIHDQSDTSLGDQEFKLSLHLLNKVLDKATKKFPETSLRIHFETREAMTNFMYIFVEPVTEEQVAEIQSQRDAKIREFERNTLGLHPTDGADGEETAEDGSEWEHIQADVQEAMDKDELSLDNPNTHDGAYEDHSNASQSSSDQQVILNQGSLYANTNGAQAGDDFHKDGEVKTGEIEEQVSEDVAENEDNKEADRSEGNGKGLEELGNMNSGDNENQRVDEADEAKSRHQEAPENDQAVDRRVNARNEIASEAAGNDISQSGSSKNKISEVLEVGSQADQPQQAVDPLQSKSDTGSPAPADLTLPVPVAEDREYQSQADRPFLDSIAKDDVRNDERALASGSEVLAMTLTIRNKVNNKFVLRPQNLTLNDKWSIEYSLAEVTSPSRATALYQACQTRRKKQLDSPERPEDTEVISSYLRNLRRMSADGKVWRKERDQADKQHPVHVLESDTVRM